MTNISPFLFGMYVAGLSLVSAGIASVAAHPLFPQSKYAAPENFKRNERIMWAFLLSGGVLHTTADLIRFFTQ